MDERTPQLDVDYMDDDEFRVFAEHFDLFDARLQELDLTDFFARLREQCPMVRTRSRAGDVWMISRHEDLRRVMQDPETFSNRVVVWPYQEANQVLLNDDGEKHLKYRQMLAPMFTPQRAAALAPFIRDVARRRAESIRAAGGAEIVSEFARPIPNEVFLHSFGVDPQMLPVMTAAADAAFRLPDDEAGARRAYEGNEVVSRYFARLVQARRAQGEVGDDIVGELVRARIDGEPLTETELANLLSLLTAASLDTTASAFANMLTWLVRHPTRRDELVADPSLIPGAVEELLRYDQMTFNGRLVRRDVELGGRTLSAGERVMFANRAAGRDPRVFPDPERVDFRRSPNRHLAFGVGPHRCIGMHLARLTLQIELEEWHRAIPRYSIAPGTTPRRRLTMLTTFTELHVRVED
jgi:cytochrome P450